MAFNCPPRPLTQRNRKNLLQNSSRQNIWLKVERSKNKTNKKKKDPNSYDDFLNLEVIKIDNEENLYSIKFDAEEKKKSIVLN